MRSYYKITTLTYLFSPNHIKKPLLPVIVLSERKQDTKKQMLPYFMQIRKRTNTAYNFIRKTASAAVILVLLLQVIGLFESGINYDSLKYPLGTGVLMVICIVIMEIIRYMQKIDHSTRQNAKMFIYAAVLFEYATF